jgi:hypothetical protein
MSRAFAIGALLAAAVLALVLLPGRRDPAGAPRAVAPAPAGAPPGAGGASATASYRWELAASAGPRSGPREETTITGTLNARITTASERRQIAFQLSGLSVQVGGRREAELERAYQRPFVLEIDDRGRFGPSRFDPAIPPRERAVLDAAIRLLQVVLPTGDEARWETREADGVGEYDAAYVREAHGGVTKRKLRYGATRGATPLSARVVASELRAELAPGPGWLRRAAGSERLDLAAGDGGVLASTSTRFTLEPSPAPVDPNLAVWRDRPFEGTGVAVDGRGPSAWDAAAVARARDRFQRQGTTLDGLLAGLGTHDVRDAAFAHELAEFLRAFPEEAHRATARLGTLADLEAAVLLSVLELAGTPEAQDALVRLASSPGASRANRLRAVAGLAGVAEPTGDTLAALERLSATPRRTADDAELASASLLAYGALAGRAGDALRGGAMSRLEATAREAPTAEEARVALRALGNARLPPPLDLLTTRLASPDPGVREAATELLAQRPEAATAETLRSLFEHDPAAPVRRSALLALASHPSGDGANAAVADALAAGREEDPSVRVEMARFLAGRIPRIPENRQLLLRELQRERDRGVILAILNAMPR